MNCDSVLPCLQSNLLLFLKHAESLNDFSSIITKIFLAEREIFLDPNKLPNIFPSWMDKRKKKKNRVYLFRRRMNASIFKSWIVLENGMKTQYAWTEAVNKNRRVYLESAEQKQRKKNTVNRKIYNIIMLDSRDCLGGGRRKKKHADYKKQCV